MDFNKKIAELKPHHLNCNVFDVYSYNGLSMQDLLCQFFTKINECITVSNETIDLAKWLVNEGLEIEVVKKLMIWLEDGTLENIINVNLFESLNDKINGLSSQLEHIENDLTSIHTLNILDFGAREYDEITQFDSTQAFKDAIMNLKECQTLVANGKFLINDLDIELPNDCTLDLKGEIVTTSNNYSLKIKTRNSNIYINKISKIGNREGIGLIIENCYNSTFTVNYTKNFDKGLILRGTKGEGTQYCRYIFQYMDNNNNIQLIYDSENFNGWVNENTFVGGRLVGGNGIETVYDVPNSKLEFHNNKFYNIGFEWLSGFGVKLRYSTSSSFYSPRFENVTGLWIDQDKTCKCDMFAITSWIVHSKCKTDGLKNDFIGYEAKMFLPKGTQGVSSKSVDLLTNVGTLVIQSDSAIATINLKSELHKFNGFSQIIRVSWFVNDINFTLDGEPLVTIGTINKEGLYELRYNQSWYLVKLEASTTSHLSSVTLGSNLSYMGNRKRCVNKRDDGLKIINLSIQSTGEDFGTDKTLFTMSDEFIPRSNGNKIGIDFNAIGRDSAGNIYPCIVAVGNNGVAVIKTKYTLHDVNINVSYY